MAEFYSLYYKNVFTQKNPEYLTEAQLKDVDEHRPIAVDIDFRFAPDISERQHSEEYISDIIGLYLEKIKEIKILEEDFEFSIYVFEKNNVNKLNDVTKDGIHIIFGLAMNTAEQIYLRKLVLSEIATLFTQDELPVVNNWNLILDEGITKGTTNWQLYGSRKPKNEPYKLTYVYSITYNDDDFGMETCEGNSYSVNQNFEKLSIRYSKHPTLETNPHIVDEIMNNSASTNNRRRKQPSNSLNAHASTRLIHLHEITNREVLNRQMEIWLEDKNTSNNFHLKEIYDYVMILPSSYYDLKGTYQKWLHVCFALKNCSDKMGLVWLYFSAQANGFDFNQHLQGCIDLWEKDRDNNDTIITERSIMYWVKSENPVEYAKIYHDSVQHYINKSLESKIMRDLDIAELLFKCYGNKFICTDPRKGIWYEFVNHKWEDNILGVSLRKHIMENIYNMYMEKVRELMKALIDDMDDSNDNDSEQVRKNIQRRLNSATTIAERLGVDSNINSIMSVAKTLFHDKHFIKKMNKNPYLMCFNNGVIDFSTKEFRDGFPEDYNTMTTDICYYRKDQIQNYPEIEAEINEFMYQLFPVEELRTYMWEHLASVLIGKNKEQTFNIYNGNGSNGKSLLVDLMSEILGEYKGTVPITLIADKRSKIGSATPEMAQLAGKRYAVIQEPSKGDTLNEGIVKEITGGDTLTGRSLYQDQITFSAQFKLVVCTNTLMDIKSNDDGTWRRIRLCEFMSKFVDKVNNDDADNPYQFKKDTNLSKKFSKWKYVFMEMLVQIAFKKEGNVTDCKTVTAKSDSYRNQQDYLGLFFKDKIKVDPEGCVRKREVSECYKQWYDLQYGKSKIKCTELYDALDKKYGRQGKHNGSRAWTGISIIYDEEDDDE